MNSWFARKKNKYDKPQNVKGFRNNRFWRILLRTISIAPVLSMLVAATLFYPASAIAKTAPAAIAAPAVTAATAPIITCPISAATELRLMVRLVYAAFMGAVLGKERSAAKHSAGVRTMSLVSMGAAVFTVCSCYGFANFPRVDASRMAASVASGVGFVGAGVITTSVHNQDRGDPNNPQNNVVHGLTTAATIWLSAAVGVSCGVGLLRVATTTAFATIFILRMGRKGKKKPSTTNDENYRLQLLQQQQNQLSTLINSDVGNQVVMNATKLNDDDDNDDAEDEDDTNAEIHMTSYWDEHPDHESEEDDDKNIPSIHSEFPEAQPEITDIALQQQQQQQQEQANDYLKDPSELMEEVVRSLLKDDNKTVTALVDLVLERVEDRDRVSKHRGKSEDHSSSSNPDYLP